MAFNTTRQLEFDGHPLPHLGVRLITSPLFRADRVDGNVVFSVTPYGFDAGGNIVRPVRISYVADENQNVVEVVEDDRSLDATRNYGDAYEAAKSDPRKAQALGLISQGIQLLIEAEGL